jgi:hypothetical protein
MSKRKYRFGREFYYQQKVVQLRKFPSRFSIQERIAILNGSWGSWLR